jgi:hypothetical protein
MRQRAEITEMHLRTVCWMLHEHGLERTPEELEQHIKDEVQRHTGRRANTLTICRYLRGVKGCRVAFATLCEEMATMDTAAFDQQLDDPEPNEEVPDDGVPDEDGAGTEPEAEPDPPHPAEPNEEVPDNSVEEE